MGGEPLDAFAGIDVAFARGKRLPVCICTRRGGRLLPLPLRRRRDIRPPHGHGNAGALDPGAVHGFAAEAHDYLCQVERTEGLRIVRVAIDAPRAPCAPGLRRRTCERAMDARRISCFPTPGEAELRAIEARARKHLRDGGAPSRLPHANQLWMLAGFGLFRVLEREWECLEVFPQATVRVLGADGGHKTRPAGLRGQLAAVAARTGWPDPGGDGPRLGDIAYGSPHDRLDAYLSAWVAGLAPEERTACGEAPDDVIWVPRPDGPGRAGQAR